MANLLHLFFANFKSIATVEQYSHLKDYKLEISDGTLSAIISGNPENPENPENPKKSEW
ncbi:hypothetical protein KZ779_03265 [Escherichia coli]|nr:hypothetical protein [Escherichia coli]